jgi:tRNA1Val (adenine37-N6)-methyltransferase
MMTDALREDERLDDLQRKGYKIIQNTKIFCFGIDAVLLAAFAKLDKDDSAIDLGTGNGIIPMLMEARYGGKHLDGLEIQDINVDMARRSVAMNNLTGKVDIVQGDIKEASKIFGAGKYDVVTSNPPYMNADHGLTNPDSCKAIARHEILCTLDDVCREASRLLKFNGHFYMIHRPHRLVEIFDKLTEYKLEPKRVRFVHPFADKEPNMVLIDAVKGAKSMVKIESPLVVYERPGEYTRELWDIHYN